MHRPAHTAAGQFGQDCYAVVQDAFHNNPPMHPLELIHSEAGKLMFCGCRSANGIDEPLLAAEAGEDLLKLPPSVLVKSAMPAHDEDSDDDTPHALAAAQPAAPRRGLLRRIVGFFDSQGGATVCSIWLCLILKVVQQARSHFFQAQTPGSHLPSAYVAQNAGDVSHDFAQAPAVDVCSLAA